MWGYLKALFSTKANALMDPEIEIEQAIQEAKEHDQNLRNQAAKVVAHRTQLERKIEKAADDVGEAREMAKQALLKAEAAKNAGDTEGMEKWTRAAQTIAMKLQASESNLNGLKGQYEVAVNQAEDAKRAVEQNAMRLQELAAKRMQLVGALEQAKMQESVNKALDSLNTALDTEAPSLANVEEKIDKRLAEAQARAELREAISMTQADAKLEELKAELGL